MTYVVTEACIKCKFMDCVEVCPVDCFYEGENMLVINPDECIDCGVCEPECPPEAIKADTESGLEKWLSVNAEYAKSLAQYQPEGRGAGRRQGLAGRGRQVREILRSQAGFRVLSAAPPAAAKQSAVEMPRRGMAGMLSCSQFGTGIKGLPACPATVGRSAAISTACDNSASILP